MPPNYWKQLRIKGCPINKEREENTVAFWLPKTIQKRNSFFFITATGSDAPRQCDTDPLNDTDIELTNGVLKVEQSR